MNTSALPAAGSHGTGRSASPGRIPRNWLAIGLAVVVALALVTAGVIVASRGSTRASVAKANLISMDEAAQAMQQAGAVMQTHGQAMVDQGQSSGDQDLAALGQQWLQDGQQIALGGQWMAMDPTDPSNLDSPSGMATEGNRSELSIHAQAMLHDPSKATAVNIEALRDDGLAMQGEARNMVQHARVMGLTIDLMLARHQVDDQTAAELRQATQALKDAGNRLVKNAQQMINYADRMHRSLGGGQ